MRLYPSFKKIIISLFFVLSLFTIFSFNFESGNYSIANAFGETESNQANIELQGNWFKQGIAAVFLAVIRVCALLTSISVAIITWTLTPEFMKIISNTGIYTGWSTVRDVLNVFFIFFLLYSAFCTVFQVSRYHIKSTWVMIVVMALLVNFSWPIARTMIDFSNITMIYFIGDSDPKNSSTLLSGLAHETKFLEIVIGGVSKVDHKANTVTINVSESANLFTSLFIGIIASFLFAITVGAIAFILVIRTIAFAIYLVFASVGFTMAAFPMTRSYASTWWSGFTKQLIIGPAMVFGLFLAATVLKALNDEGFKAQADAIGQQQGVVGAILNYLVAIMLIWSVIIAASKVGSEGSSFVVGKANAAAKWGGRKVKSGAWGGTKMVGRGADHTMAWATNKAANSQNTKFQKLGKSLGALRTAPDRAKNWSKGRKDAYADALEEAKAHGLAVGGIGGDKNAVKNVENKKVSEMKKKWKDDNVSTDQLIAKLDKASGAEERALIEYLTSQKDGIGDKEIGALVKKLDSDKVDDGLKKLITNKSSETGNAHVLLKHQLSKPGADAHSIYNNTLANMDAQTMAKQRGLFEQIQTNPDLGKVGLDLQRRLSDNSFKVEFLKQGGGNQTIIAARNGGYIK